MSRTDTLDEGISDYGSRGAQRKGGRHTDRKVASASRGKSLGKIYSDLQTDDTNVQDAILKDFSMPTTFSYSELLSGGNGYQVGLIQQSLPSNLTPSPDSFTFNVQDKPMQTLVLSP
ncbi:transcription factor SPT20 homolog [Striga asiatica]|uniref:Transcription factor SPT20 homolog n=1 Tax=Striga asiatica TaxID=4170 RepID=A0A5A7RKU7_STRAF|nr:transcription factor SPT20 homolog [Striga asiatica]